MCARVCVCVRLCVPERTVGQRALTKLGNAIDAGLDLGALLKAIDGILVQGMLPSDARSTLKVCFVLSNEAR